MTFKNLTAYSKGKQLLAIDTRYLVEILKINLRNIGMRIKKCIKNLQKADARNVFRFTRNFSLNFKCKYFPFR